MTMAARPDPRPLRPPGGEPHFLGFTTDFTIDLSGGGTTYLQKLVSTGQLAIGWRLGLTFRPDNF
jgi:hypothetical protein